MHRDHRITFMGFLSFAVALLALCSCKSSSLDSGAALASGEAVSAETYSGFALDWNEFEIGNYRAGQNESEVEFFLRTELCVDRQNKPVCQRLDLWYGAAGDNFDRPSRSPTFAMAANETRMRIAHRLFFGKSYLEDARVKLQQKPGVGSVAPRESYIAISLYEHDTFRDDFIAWAWMGIPEENTNERISLEIKHDSGLRTQLEYVKTAP